MLAGPTEAHCSQKRSEVLVSRFETYTAVVCDEFAKCLPIL